MYIPTLALFYSFFLYLFGCDWKSAVAGGVGRGSNAARLSSNPGQLHLVDFELILTKYFDFGFFFLESCSVALKLLENCSGIARKLLGNCSETALEKVR